MVPKAFLLASVVPILVSASTVGDCPGYTVSNVDQGDQGLTANLKLAGTACNVYGDDLTDLKLLVEYQTNARLHVKIYDPEEQVYQIPTAVLDPPTGSGVSSNASALRFTYSENPFSFAIQRSDTHETIFNTSGTNLIFESQYLRLRTSLPIDPNIYGLGEDVDSFRRETTNYTRTLYNQGTPFFPVKTNLYGSHPVYYEMRDGRAHGVFLSNSDGMDIVIDRTTSGEQYLEYNTIGGVVDLYFLAGPSPMEVGRQYADVVGKPVEQAYWTFGYHQCKYGYQDVMMLAEVVQNYSQAGIPLEVMWTDIDYMERRRTWTLDPDRFPLHKMQEFVSYLHEHNQSYVMMVDPPVALQDPQSYQRITESDATLKSPNGSAFQGVMWPGAVVYPDWFHPNVQSFWSGQVSSFFNAESGVNVDAVWIDMNDPVNDCVYPCPDATQYAKDHGSPPEPPPIRQSWPPLPGFPPDFQPPQSKDSELRKRQSGGSKNGLPGRNLIDPPYKIKNGNGPIYKDTVYPDVTQSGGYVMYDTHNLFASGMITATREALLNRRPGIRPLIISRSTFAGSGAKAGHWTGDNASRWEHYRISIWQNMEFATLFQIPMVGADICGFNEVTTEELCSRWTTLGSFYPFFRNHKDINAPFQELYRWPLVTKAAQSAIKTRYQLLDYFYTGVHQQSKDGTPSTIIPMFFLYPEDKNTLTIDLQFFFGPSLLVSPVTQEGATSVEMYLPNDVFYDFFTGKQVRGSGAKIIVEDVDVTQIPVHVRGGSVVPMRVDGANTTAQLRELDFMLLIAPSDDGTAKGSLYLDDGVSISPKETSEITFEYKGGELSVGGTFGFPSKRSIESVTLYGTGDPKKVQIGKPLTEPFTVQVG